MLPAHNEEALVARTLRSLPRWVDSIICVDDASVDRTLYEMQVVAREDHRISILEHGTNRGVGAAIVSGFRIALENGTDIVVVMDADGQMDPADLPSLLDEICAGNSDMAKGNRLIGLHPFGPMPFGRFIGNHILSLLTRLAAGSSEPVDSQCGYVALRTNVVADLPLDSLYPRYGFPNDLYFKVIGAGGRVVSVPVRAVYGTEISGIRPLEAIPKILWLLFVRFVERLRPRGPSELVQAVKVDEAP